MKYKIKLILGFFLILILFISCSSKRKRGIQNIDPDSEKMLKEFKPLSISSTKSNLSGTRMADKFLTTDVLSEERFSHTATLLRDGNVLIAGGRASSGPPFSSAEVYNLTEDKFYNTGFLKEGRCHHTATLLNNDKVLIVGGSDTNNVFLKTAELYGDIDTFDFTTDLAFQRLNHTATLLRDGNVLIAGGRFDTNAEIYIHTIPKFTYAGSLKEIRFEHTATLLKDGTVLIVGGEFDSPTPFPSAEVYDPTTGEFTYTTGSLNEERQYHTATLLKDGTVLIVGGYGGLSSAEVYDPTTGKFTYTGSLNEGRQHHTATLLKDGTVLIVGGRAASYSPLPHAEVYDPTTGKFTYTESLNEGRYNHTATLLKDGTVLIVGGYCGQSGCPSSEEVFHRPLLLGDDLTCTVKASGGTPPYTYSVVSGGGTIIPSSGEYIADTIYQSGAVTVKVIDAAGNEATTNIFVDVTIVQ